MTRLKNGKVVKVKDRGMMLTTYPGRKVVMIISPDSTGRTVVLTELMIFKERPGRLPLTSKFSSDIREAGSCSGVYPDDSEKTGIAARFFIFLLLTPWIEGINHSGHFSSTGTMSALFPAAPMRQAEKEVSKPCGLPKKFTCRLPASGQA